MKGYFRENFPTSIDVKVVWTDIPQVHVDSIKGLNAGHALWRARRNWPDAAIVGRIWRSA